jgi:hypothetical protein
MNAVFYNTAIHVAVVLMIGTLCIELSTII